MNKSVVDTQRFGLESPTEALETVDVLEAISKSNPILGPIGDLGAQSS